MINVKSLVKAVLVACLVASLTLVQAYAETLDKVAALVNNDVVTDSEVTQDIRLNHFPDDAETRKKVLNRLIDQKLELEVAQTLKITVTKEDIDNALNMVAKTNNVTMEALKSKISEEGLTFEQYRKQIEQQLIIQKLQNQEIGPRIEISDQEVRDYLEQHPMAAVGNIKYKITDYLVSNENSKATKQGAELVAKQLKNNQAVDSTLVETNDLGWRKIDELPEVFKMAMVKVNNPGVIGPITAPNGWHILQITEMDPPNAKRMVTETHVRHILLKEDALNNAAVTRQRLVDMEADIDAGGDFAKFAEDVSQDPGSAVQGGDLGWVKPGLLHPDFQKAMDKLAVNQVSSPVKSPFGWHLIQVLGRRQVDNSSQQNEIAVKEIIFRKKFEEKLPQFISQLRQGAYIKIM